MVCGCTPPSAATTKKAASACEAPVTKAIPYVVKPENVKLGMPTWYDGELQGDWESYISEMEQIDFSNKKVAFFGLGDQYGYASYFCDALAVFAEIVEKKNGKLYGFMSTAGFEHDFSKAQRGDQFVGLCLDVDNQEDLTEPRIQQWVGQVVGEFGL